MTEEAAKSIEKPIGKIPSGYVLETIYRENDKSYEAWHHQVTGHWIMHEVGSKW